MSTLQKIEDELKKREAVDLPKGCPLALIEKCGLTDIGANALCRRCQTALHFIEAFIARYQARQLPVNPPFIQDEIDRLIADQKTHLGKTVNDEYVGDLILLFIQQVTNYLEIKHQSLDKIPTKKLLFLHGLQMLKERVETFQKIQDPDIDEGMRATVEKIIQTISDEVISAQ